MKTKKIIVAVPVMVFILACTAGQKKDFEGIRVIFFAGGFKDDSFASVVYKGAQQAQMDFGCSVDYVFSQWVTDKMVDDFKDAIEKKPDGICMMGHPGDAALMPLVDEAMRKGILVTSQNVELPEIEEKYFDRGFGYAGQNTYGSGYSLAKMCVKRLGIRSGDRILVWGLSRQGTRQLRTTGSVDFFREQGIGTDYLEMKNEDWEKPLESGYESFMGYYKTHNDLALIIVDAGVLTAAMPDLLKKAGIPPDKIHCVGYDLSQGTAAGIKEGYIDFVNDQQPFLQGYLPVLQICLAKKYGFSGLHIDTGSSFVDESNLGFLEALVKQRIR